MLLNTLFSNTLNLRSSLNMNDQSLNRTKLVVFRLELLMFNKRNWMPYLNITNASPANIHRYQNQKMEL